MFGKSLPIRKYKLRQMITKYDEFLLEQVLIMINESEVVFSKKFRKLLTNIDSPISAYLTSLENSDLNVFSNYFDISDTKDAISFIPDKKAQEILGGDKEKYVIYEGDGGFLTHNRNDKGEYTNETMFNQLGYTPGDDDPYRPDGGERGEVVSKATSRTTGKVYLYVRFPAGECVINEEKLTYDDNSRDLWTKNRQQIRIGRGIRTLLNAKNKSAVESTKFTDSEVEDFVNKYKSAYDKMNDIYNSFELVSGDDISYWYDHKHYLNGGEGQLGNSCMSSVPKDYFKIYTSNPEVCSLLILKDESGDKIKGRALVWNLRSPEITFMDRIYTNQDSDMQLFKDYSKFKKWEYKKHNDSSPEGETINSDGKSVDYPGGLSVFINKKIEYSRFPYVDTLKYFNRTTGELSTNEDDGSVICLEDTQGGYAGSECDTCGGSGTVECWECDGNGEFDCDDCDGTGKQECEDCKGEGKIGDKQCPNCDGRGDYNCDDCNGRGVRTCRNCGGDGRVDCRDCN